MRARPRVLEMTVLLAVAVAPPVAGDLVLGRPGVQAGVAVGLAAALLVLRLLVPAPPPVPRRARGVTHEHADFPRYRALASAVGWAGQSPRHFDRTLRPVLLQIARARLADRHAIDLDARPDLARGVLGEQVWALIDPVHPASDDSRGAGVPLPVIARVLERLERL